MSIVCAAGQYRSPQRTTCNNCTDGYWCPSGTLEVDHFGECHQGWICPGGVPQPCPPGYSSAYGAIQCQPCGPYSFAQDWGSSSCECNTSFNHSFIVIISSYHHIIQCASVVFVFVLSL
jgi:hypothetical protein